MLFDWANQPWYTLIVTYVFGPYFVSRVAADPVHCPSHLFHLSQKSCNFSSPPDTLSGMHKIIKSSRAARRSTQESLPCDSR